MQNLIFHRLCSVLILLYIIRKIIREFFDAQIKLKLIVIVSERLSTPPQMSVEWLKRNFIEIEKLMYIRKILWTIPISSRNDMKF